MIQTKKPRILLVHPGTQHSRHLAKELQNLGLLYEFWTIFVIPENGIFSKILNFFSKSYYKKFSNRIVRGIDHNKIKTTPYIELKYLIKGKAKHTEQLLYQRNLAFQNAIPNSAFKNCDVIVGFDTSSFILAEKAKRYGKFFILDQSIGHASSKSVIFEKLNELYPEHVEQLHSKSKHLIELENKEHKLADYIVTASTFTKSTLLANFVNKEKILINPYGVDFSQFKMMNRPQNEKIRFLFLGSLTIRKGIKVLFDTWKDLNPLSAELWIAGPSNEKINAIIPEMNSIHFLGKIPHKELQETIRSCDVLVFPSYFEGFGLVILEAMACGLTVITTEATAGPDLIDQGVDGVLYDSFDANQLKSSIKYFIDKPEKAKEMGLKAAIKVQQFTWEAYGKRWSEIINKLNH